jgi:thiamine biosynthesis protein ThiS
MTTDTVRIILNGEPRDMAPGATLASLLVELKLTPDKVAIELNRRLVRAERYGETALRPDDQVEVVTFVGGG